MKKIALLAIILTVGILASACLDKVAIRPTAEVTLADGTVVHCAEGELLWLYARSDYDTNLNKLSCTDVKGLSVSIPADKVVKIEIRAVKK